MALPESAYRPIFRGSNCSKVYMDAVDKNVSKTIIYINDSGEGGSNPSHTPYADEAGTRALSADELLNACIKGAVVSYRNADKEIVMTVSEVFRSDDGDGLVTTHATLMVDGSLHHIVATT